MLSNNDQVGLAPLQAPCLGVAPRPYLTPRQRVAKPEFGPGTLLRPNVKFTFHNQLSDPPVSTDLNPEFMDLEQGPDVPDEDVDNSSDGNPQHGSDGTIGGSSIEATSQPEQSLECHGQESLVLSLGWVAEQGFHSESRVMGRGLLEVLIKEHTHPLALPESQSPKARGNPKIYQVPADDRRVHELMRELMVEKKRNASLREFIHLLFNHIEEHTQGLSEKIQCVVEKVKKIESDGKNSGSEIVVSL
ncbi:hypothetical protein OIU85_006373 [Salix viminalis]|uniref:Uncharacterized protein n=1 Tax=Salix viminalis TaxID=40686 RepID=A0A9Q0PKS4_SALVM|nr:hypothetical protein OIU85_006373 [Salix viminalis]